MAFDSALILGKGSKVFGTNNAVGVTTGSGTERKTAWGICGSMSARYVKAGLSGGSPPTSAAQIGSELLIGITQAAFVINGEGSMSAYLFEVFGLKPVSTKVGKIDSWRTVAGTAQTLTGFLLFTIKAGGAGGHAMAFYMGSGSTSSHFFDPNAGDYVFGSKADCCLAVANHMKSRYDKFKGGEFKLYSVSLA